MLVVAKCNRYIFSIEALYFYALLLVLCTFVATKFRINIRIVYSLPVVLLAAYSLLLFFQVGADGVPLDFTNDWVPEVSALQEGIRHAILVSFFVFSLFIGSKYSSLPFLPYLFILFYLIAFTLMNFIVHRFYVLFHLNLGYVFFSMVPFLFLRESCLCQRIAHVVTFVLMCYLMILGARAASFCLLSFMILFNISKYISASPAVFRFMTTLAFLVIPCLIFLYLFTLSDPGRAQEFNNLSYSLTGKFFDTRYEIWVGLLKVITETGSFLGFGSGASSHMLDAPNIPERDNLASHSTYFEVLLRLGILGFSLFYAFLYTFCLRVGRKSVTLFERVGYAYVLSALFFMGTGVYLQFGMPVQSAFGWIIMGLALGASFKGHGKSRLLSS